MWTWGCRVFSTRLGDGSLCPPFSAGDSHSVVLQRVIFLQNYPKASCIFMSARLQPRHSDRSFWGVCCALAYFSLQIKNGQNLLHQGLCIRTHPRPHFHDSVKSCHHWRTLSSPSALRLHLAIDRSGFAQVCTGVQRWTLTSAQVVMTCTDGRFLSDQREDHFRCPKEAT